jgi:ATP-dependent helicase/nuclease subunit A
MSLNKAQLLATLHRQGNVLISAGAGSGKTTVLTQRVIDLIINDHVPLNRLLILTFTNAAAASMKEKIRHALIKNQREKEAIEVDASFIMTFDAFSLFLVKKYHHALSLDPQIDILPEALLTYQKKVTLNKIFDTYYASDDKPFHQLIAQYVIKNDEDLKSFILKIDAKAELTGKKEAYMHTYADTYFSSSWIDQSIQAFYQTMIDVLDDLSFTVNDFEEEKEKDWFKLLFASFKEHKDLDSLFLAFKDVSFPRATKNLSKDDIALRDELKKAFKSLKKYGDMTPIEQYILAYQATQPYLETIFSIIKNLSHQLSAYKKDVHRYSFSDIAVMATSLLDQPKYQEEIAHMFDYIMVDEYQDTNDLQESFIQKISRNNLFMVGDVKQSIYRFRNANSDIFTQKLLIYKDYHREAIKDNVIIHLNENYRSRLETLSQINNIFFPLMSPRYGGIDYIGQQQLAYGLTRYDTLKEPRSNYAFQHLNYLPSDVDKERDEPSLIAEDIIKKINQKTLIYDDHIQSMRPMTFKDIAILIDRKSSFEDFITVFNDAGIPLKVFAEQNLSASDFYKVFQNLLLILEHGPVSTIDNTLKKPYMSVLRSFMYQTPDPLLYEIMTGVKSIESTSLYKDIINLSSFIPLYSLDQFIYELVHYLELETKILSLDDISGNLARLHAIQKLAKDLTELGYTLPQFIDYLSTMTDLDIELTIPQTTVTDDAVTLMTIHKSKGLEFPYVYFPGLHKAFNFSDIKGLFQVHQTFGIHLPYPDLPLPDPLFKDLIVRSEKDAVISEYLRLWYVALTRAREQIILVYRQDKVRTLNHIRQSRSFLDFLTLSKVANMEALSIQPVHHQLPLKATQPATKENEMLVKFRSIDVPLQPIQSKRASKESDVTIDSKAIQYGALLHEYLFLIDFSHPDLNFITDLKIKEIIQKLLNQPLFKRIISGVKNKTTSVYKEYSYLDEQGQKGVIDLLVIEENTALIIDYKLSNIDDLDYQRQLSIYAEFLVNKGMTQIEKYLVSIIKNVIVQF